MAASMETLGIGGHELFAEKIFEKIKDLPSGVQMVELTKQQYDALTPEQKADPTKLYVVPGDGSYLKFREISSEDYDALTDEEKNDPTTVYLTPGTGTYFRVIDISQEDYDALPEEEKTDPQKLYLIPGEPEVETPFATCNTAASTAAKEVTCPEFGELVIGAKINVYFENTNTASWATLNVNNTGAVTIKRYNVTNVGTDTTTSWHNRSVVPLIYDGTYWRIIGHKDTGNVNQIESESVSGSYPIIFSDEALSSSDRTAEVRKSTYFKYDPMTGNILTQHYNSQYFAKYGPKEFVLESNADQRGYIRGKADTQNPYLKVSIGDLENNVWTEKKYVALFNGDDVKVFGSTWDGTNTSLKSAISSIQGLLSNKVDEATELQTILNGLTTTPSWLTDTTSLGAIILDIINKIENM